MDDVTASTDSQAGLRQETGQLGAHRAVLRLAGRTGLPVGRADIEVLVERGLLAAAGEYNGWPTYATVAIDLVPADLLREIVAARLSWLRMSADERTAAAAIGLRAPELRGWATVNGIRPGRFGRYDVDDVAMLRTLWRDAATRAGSAVPDVAGWARRMLEPGAAVILDTETIDLGGAICEIALIDPATGEILIDTLIDPGVPISDAAYRVHGINDSLVADAPCWSEILPAVRQATEGRSILAYQADYDRHVILAECDRHSLDAGHLGDSRHWDCLMVKRGDRRRLGGRHRALADCRAALDLLRALSQS